MGQQDQGVRIGPISLFTLVAALGLAVLAVLTISTARAMGALSARTALMASEAYECEVCAQELVAEIDAELASARSQGISRDEALRRLSPQLEDVVAQVTAGHAEGGLEEGGVTGSAKLDGANIAASFDSSSGRRLDIRIAIGKDLTYSIAEWKATSQAGSVEIQENLWTGTSS